MEEIFNIPYRLVRQARKTLRISINTSGNVTVYVPKDATQKAIRNFLIKNEKWLKETSEAKRACNDTALFGNIPEAPRLFYLGSPYPVSFTAKNERSACFDGERFILPSGYSANQYRSVITEIYRTLARQYIPELLDSICKQNGIIYNRIQIHTSTSRWGSCSSKKNLNFSAYLMIASEECIRLVICHELSHLNEMNHSPKFYKVLAKLEPNHKELQLKLSKGYGKILHSLHKTAKGNDVTS